MESNEEMFYIISLKWTVGDRLCFWRPKNTGYTDSVDEAGKYTKSEVYASEKYYNNGYDTIAISCDTIHSKFTIRQTVIWNSFEMEQLKKPFQKKLKEKVKPLQIEFQKGGKYE